MKKKMICTPSFYRGETNARPSSYPERRERRGLSHSTGMESNVQKQKCIIGPCDLMSTHPQQIRQERNRAAVGGLSDLSFVRCDALALLPATAVVPCLLRRSIRGGVGWGGVGWGGGSRTDGDVPPAVDAPDSPRRIPSPSRGGGRVPPGTPHRRRRQTLSPRPGRRPPPPPPSYTVPVAHRLATSICRVGGAGRHRAARRIRRGGRSPARGFRGRGWRGWFTSVGSPLSSSGG